MTGKILGNSVFSYKNAKEVVVISSMKELVNELGKRGAGFRPFKVSRLGEADRMYFYHDRRRRGRTIVFKVNHDRCPMQVEVRYSFECSRNGSFIGNLEKTLSSYDADYSRDDGFLEKIIELAKLDDYFGVYLTEHPDALYQTYA